MISKTFKYFTYITVPSKHFLFSKTSSRRLEDVFSITIFRLPRRLQDVFAIRLPKASSRRLQDVFARRLQDLFKTFSKRACKTILQDDFKKTSCNYVSKTSSRCLQDVLQDKKMLHWRRLQYVFTKTNVCWVRMTTNIGARIFINKLF